MADAPVLEVDDLTVVLRTRGREATILDAVSLAVTPGETVALVGESGAGKTVLALAVMGLLPGGMRVTGGRIGLAGTDLVGASASVLRTTRGGEMAMIFQDPQSSLHPAFRVGAQVAEAVRAHQPGVSKADATTRAVDLLRRVGIPQPDARARDYPHQMSGGMRQRVMIAMAMANRPRLLIADEATTALDVTVQAQVLDLMATQQRERFMAIVLITHDLGVVAGRADEIAVMYAGRIVEKAPTSVLFSDMRMPYTEALLSSIPKIEHASHTRLNTIPGRPPNLVNPPKGCKFAPRCAYAQPRCLEEDPPLMPGPQPGHEYRCWFPVGTPEGDEALARNRAEKATSGGAA